MFTLHAFDSSIATTSASTLSNIVPVADPVATVAGNLLYVGQFPNLLGGVLLGANITGGELQSPSLLNFAPQVLAPYIESALPTTTIQSRLQMQSPIALVTNEALQAYAKTATSGAASQTVMGVFLGDGAQAPVAGAIHTAKATFTTNSTADQWGNAAITFETVLPAGSYDVVGARAEGAHGKLFRLVFQGNSNVRPGSVFALNGNGADLEGARMGGWGTWGTFDQFTPPTVDNITDGTSETATLYLDLIKKA